MGTHFGNLSRFSAKDSNLHPLSLVTRGKMKENRSNLNVAEMSPANDVPFLDAIRGCFNVSMSNTVLFPRVFSCLFLTYSPRSFFLSPTVNTLLDDLVFRFQVTIHSTRGKDLPPIYDYPVFRALTASKADRVRCMRRPSYIGNCEIFGISEALPSHRRCQVGPLLHRQLKYFIVLR